jgi:predicted aspartyl protease
MSFPVYQSFHYSYTPVSRKLITPVEVIGISSKEPGQKTTVRALWDTGAECSVISPEISQALGLIPIGTTRIVGVNNTSPAGKVKITLILPNRIRIPNLTVLVCTLIPGADMLIGMDIMMRGDSLISNGGGETLFSFTIPSFSEKMDLHEKALEANEKIP